MISATRAPEGFAIDARIVSKGSRSNKSRIPDPIMSVPPDGTNTTITVIGVLREKQKRIDVERALKIGGRTSLSSAFLGPLSKGRWGRITVHKPSASSNVLSSYTIFVPSQCVEDPKSDKGVTVLVKLQTLNVPSFAHVWYSTYYEVLG